MDTIISDYNNDRDDQKFLDVLSKYDFDMSVIELGFKEDRKSDDKVMKYVIDMLRKIPSIKNKKILYNPEFIKTFYRIVWNLISKLSIATQNFYDFLNPIINELNLITIPNYIIFDCHSTDHYNCGRAIMIIDQGPSRFLIFNSDRGFIDTNTQMMYLGCSVPNLPKLEFPEETIKKYYGRMSKRVLKEIEILKRDFKVDVYDNNDNNGIKLVLKDRPNNILVTFILPRDYPSTAPSGTFNDLTISEAETENWSPRDTLKTIVDRLLFKHANKLFPKHKEFLCYMLLF